jgi:hypothetical protein
MGYARSICEDKPVGASSFTLEKKRRARDHQAQVFFVRHAPPCDFVRAGRGLRSSREDFSGSLSARRPANVLMPRRVSGLCAGTGAGVAVRQ